MAPTGREVARGGSRREQDTLRPCSICLIVVSLVSAPLLCLQPNCTCRILVCEAGLKHIVIIAKEDVPAGAEITYDYQFGIEAEDDKLVCLCGAPGCLGRMN